MNIVLKYYYPFPGSWVDDDFCSTRDHIFMCSCDPSVSDIWYSHSANAMFTMRYPSGKGKDILPLSSSRIPVWNP